MRHLKRDLVPAVHLIVGFTFRDPKGQRGGVFEQPPAVRIGGNQQHHAALGDTVFAAQPHLVQLKGVADRKDQRCPMFKGFAINRHRQPERRAECCQRFDHRPIGRDTAAAPAVIDAFAGFQNGGIGPDAGVVQKRVAIDLGDVRGAQNALGDDIHGFVNGFGQVQRTGEIVKGACGDNPHLVGHMRQARGDAADRSVAA